MQANECFSAIHYNWGDDSWEDFLQRIKAIGIRGVELLHTDVQGKSAAELKQLRQTFDENDVFAVAVGVGNDFCHRLGSTEFDREMEELKQRVEAAHILGTKMLRLEGGQPKENMPEANQWEAIREGVEKALKIARAEDVHLAIDNHGQITNNGQRLAQLIDYFQEHDKRVGACIDPSNFRWYGHSVEHSEALMELLAPRALHVHLKNGDGRSGKMADYTATALDEGELDIAGFIKRLVDTGYSGAWCLEYEGPPPTDDGVARGVKYARKVLDELGVNVQA
jgi:sugar phosphate isomerase/epimerase